MTFARPTVDIYHPPAGFDPMIDWFEAVSYSLVLLEEYSLAEIRSAVRAVDAAVLAHIAAPTGSPPSVPGRESDLARILAADHVWFRTSVEQLDWFFAVVERDAHGGNRQALGQYGRIFAESLRRHRRDERALLAATAGPAGQS